MMITDETPLFGLGVGSELTKNTLNFSNFNAASKGHGLYRMGETGKRAEGINAEAWIFTHHTRNILNS